jgi:hypothetical protein
MQTQKPWRVFKEELYLRVPPQRPPVTEGDRTAASIGMQTEGNWINWRNIPITLVDQRSKRVNA